MTVILGAMIRKLVHVAFGMLKSGEPPPTSAGATALRTCLRITDR